MLSISAVPNCRRSAPGDGSSGSSSISDIPIGSIISAVAVLLTHMLRNADAAMIPPITAPGRVPNRRTVSSAMRRGSPTPCIAFASRNPPRNR